MLQHYFHKINQAFFDMFALEKFRIVFKEYVKFIPKP